MEKGGPVTTGGFDAEGWVVGLTTAITELAEIQHGHWTELEAQRQARSERDRTGWSPWGQKVHELSSFYGRASSEGAYFERNYGPLCDALKKARRALAAHPVLERVGEPSTGNDKLTIYLLSGGGACNMTSIVAGLVARGSERGIGYRAAAAELKALLDTDNDRPEAWPLEDLSVGCHLALFHGLRVTEEISIDDEQQIVPFESVEPYVVKEQLRGEVLSSAAGNGWNWVGAVMKPFRWKPWLRGPSEKHERQLDWGGSFFEDAEDLIQLLAVGHASPVVCLLTVPDCTHRAASHLLGLPHYHTSYAWGRSARGFDKRTGGRDVDMEVVDRTLAAFGQRRSQGYRDCAPAVSRLAEALARSGQFRLDDQILDVAIALERMYDLDQGEISFKLKTRAAFFLAADSRGRRKVFDDVTEFYNTRSSIVHKGKKQTSLQAKAEAFTKGFDVARRTIDRFLREGRPKDWNDVVIGGVDGAVS